MPHSLPLQDLFPSLTDAQSETLLQLAELYKAWNEKINLISRKDIDNILPHHIIHSLSILYPFTFPKGSSALDFGTGGGLPGIPLAIALPHVQFHLIDSVGKKIRVVQEIAQELKLTNITAQQIRGEELKRQYTYVISRAVTDLPQLWRWSRGLLLPSNPDSPPNGLIALKGGDTRRELAPFGSRAKIWEISDFLPLPYFQEKRIVFVPARSR